MKFNTLHDVFVDQLKDLYSAEAQLIRAMPKMAKMSKSPELIECLEANRRRAEALGVAARVVEHRRIDVDRRRLPAARERDGEAARTAAELEDRPRLQTRRDDVPHLVQHVRDVLLARREELLFRGGSEIRAAELVVREDGEVGLVGHRPIVRKRRSTS